VTGYLLDTNVCLISLEDPDRLSDKVERAVAQGPIYLSVISYWEVIIKSMKGKLDVGNPRIWWFEALEELAANTVLLRAEHIDKVYSLPPIHKDPFDRMLIAQAIAEGLTLVTTDAEIARYASPNLQVIF